MNIREIDHITLTVSDIARSERFYHEVFDMPILIDAPFAGVRAGKQRIYFVTPDQQPQFAPAQATTGSIALSVVAKNPIEEIVNHLKSYFIEIIDNPKTRQGTHGDVQSLLIKDPDGNLIEIANY
ncbi:VOC family protein [Pediococcus pentosaceus]|jgi:catechol 2,3-dioxygenase-like lactoylglutathione lyase family enzyme|uniref:VOC family protein n=1 Tax=Pediococcus pentosaceus TaxID=1255 RepID=A0A6L5A1T0_PEDPE|nr:VOC family protein [Pediococcus pentosaceus]MCZ3393204.1 VOC family protein [Enterococcus faecium]ANI98369.1 glyoxalase [Pediococcus pentosaceus]KAF0351112.1 VOC family protein [Pediococcus pentosaceus]KAF0413482.1 VOC family protein [Pediococcus pentosaceus]KAF0421812.1 VOC family protein [Pediococcus pentosaceus]